MSAERYARKQTETDWFSGSTKPAYVRVYRRVGIWVHQFGSENSNADGYAYWSGTAWSRSQPSPKLAFEHRGRSSDFQPRYGTEFNWLGLKRKA